MPTEIKKEIQIEIAHVLFIDIVGYSKLSINEQGAAIGELTQAVGASEQVQNAEAAARLIKIPTGDGMALVFYRSPEEPVECALEISRVLKDHPKMQLRMGVHSGPVSGVIDVNGQANLAGAGLNMAQRVMDCADAGHILLSKRVADDLGEYEHWRPLLHDLGECEVKHGIRVSLVNLYADDVGNSTLPKKFLALKKHRARRRWAAATAALLALAAIVAAFAMFSRNRVSAPEKSIAVLPFENLSEEKANAYFANGIQDEILTRLAKIASLKVISRTSTKQYDSRPGNLNDIAKQLGVATILEGSVQKVGAKIRVNVQLIKASSDAHLWAETYDRELSDVLAVESEVATEIASALRAALSPEEKARIDEKPTNNPEAYALYLRAREVLDQAADLRGEIERAAGLYEQALAIDPKFALAHAQLATVMTSLFLVYEPLEAFMMKARAAAEESVGLKPELGEAHMALGYYFDYIDRNYDAAAKEYEIARRVLPNDSVLIRRIGLMQRRQGHWKDGLAALEHAASLDPRNILSMGWLGGAYEDLRNWTAAEEVAQRCLAVALTNSPQQVAEQEFLLGFTHLGATGDPSLLQKAMAEVPLDFDPGGLITQFRYRGNMYLHDFDAAEKVLDRSPLTVFENPWGAPVTKSFLQGCAVAARGDSARARLLFEAALPQAENEVKEHPETASRHAQLGMVYANLGRKEDALREGRRAMELLPESKDAYYGVDITNMFALICARLGDGDLAIPLIERLIRIPRGLPFQELRLSPDWDPLRKDPRFQKILASPEPKVIYN